jgi:hypothetical protein
LPGVNTNIEFLCAERAGPTPNVPVELPVKLAEKAIVQKARKTALAGEDLWNQFLHDLRLYALFKVIHSRLANRLIKELASLRDEGFQFVVGYLCFAVSRRQHRQAFDLRSARNFSTLGERTNPAGTTLRSNKADASVDRTAKRLMASLATIRGFTPASLQPQVAVNS